jgi:hypothetical protein
MDQELQPTVSVSQIVKQMISAGKISRRDYQKLYAAILADDQIDEEERTAINKLFDAIQAGRLKITD